MVWPQHLERADVTIEKSRREFQGHEGIELVADAWGSPGDPAVLLLHGGGQTRHAWGGTAEALAGAGWYAVSLDLRGHGESAWCPDGHYNHSNFAADVAAVANSLERPPVLVGASLGGISSLLALALAGEQIASALVLVDIATRMERVGVNRIVDFMLGKPEGYASLDAVADAIAEYNPHRPRPKDLKGLEKNLRRSEDGRYHWHWDPAFLAGPRRFSSSENSETEHKVSDPGMLDQAARSLTLPTLLVRGRMSDLLSEEGAKIFLEQVPHAKFADVSGAGHMVAGDRNDIFTRAVIDFLEQEVRPR
jgi:pimeloyl-ACP methyl ester carboxylesterase